MDDVKLELTYSEVISTRFALRHYAKYFEDVGMHEDAAHFIAISEKLGAAVPPISIKLGERAL